MIRRRSPHEGVARPRTSGPGPRHARERVIASIRGTRDWAPTEELQSEDPVNAPDEHDDVVADDPTSSARVWDADELADEMSEESFPTSDPPSTWGGDAR